MINKLYKATLLALGLSLILMPLHAEANGLIGTSVTGGLFFGANTTNGFDPANGAVPSGYSNTAGTMVTVASPAIEFGYQDVYNTDSANFNASQFTIEDFVASSYPSGVTNASFSMTFTDSAFSGLSLTKATDFFPNGGLTAALTGNTITVTWAGGTVNPSDDYTSTFTLSAVPEPSTWAAMGVGALVLALAVRRQQRKSVQA